MHLHKLLNLFKPFSQVVSKSYCHALEIALNGVSWALFKKGGQQKASGRTKAHLMKRYVLVNSRLSLAPRTNRVTRI